MLGETRETSRGLVVSIGTPHLSFGMTTMLVRGPLDLGVMSFRKVDDIAAELNSDLYLNSPTLFTRPYSKILWHQNDITIDFLSSEIVAFRNDLP